jgi:hypothetical protein
MNELRILGILIPDRVKDALKIQQALTKYGCSIKTRLGLHEASSETCARNGLIILELTGKKEDWDALEKELSAIDGIKIEKMSFAL